MNIKTKAVRISSELYFQIKELAIIEGREIRFLVNKAIENFLKAKKVYRE